MQQAIQKVRVKIGSFELEIEGESAYEQFDKLRKDGISGLLPSGTKEALSSRVSPEISITPFEPSTDATSRPSLADLAVRDVARSEREWVVVYALYLTERGKSLFSNSDLWGLYKESSRDNRSRQANLSMNITRCVKAQWLTKIKDDSYALAQDGKQRAVEIVSRTAAPNKARRKMKGKAKGK